MNPFSMLTATVTKPTDPATWRQYALGKKGALGVVVSTGVLEGITQAIEIAIPQSQTILNVAPSFLQNKTGRLGHYGQMMNHLDLRDLIVLAPAMAQGIAAIKTKNGKGKHLMAMGAGIGMKVLMRITGINPRLLNKGTTAPQAPRVMVGSGLNTSMGVTP